MEHINKHLIESNIKQGLEDKYLKRKISIYILLGLFIINAYLCQLIHATGELASNQVYFLN